MRSRFDGNGHGGTQPTELLFHKIKIRAGLHEPRLSLDQEPGTQSMQALNLAASQGYQNVTVYYAMFNGNGKPRNTSDFNVVGVLGNYVDRDKQMCSIANYGLAIWDGKSRGTAANIQRVKRTKVIFV